MIYYRWNAGVSFNTFFFSAENGKWISNFETVVDKTLVHKDHSSCVLSDFNQLVTSFTETSRQRFLIFFIDKTKNEKERAAIVGDI